MMDTALSDAARESLEQIGHADMVIGIPSFRNAATIGHVVDTIGEGVSRYFPDLRAVIINPDGGSLDGTRESVLQRRVPAGIEKVVFTYRGISGKGTALRGVFEAVERLGARVCVVVDADLRSITPEWVRLLAQPVLDGYGFVTPFYTRYKYDGTITNSICYPMTCALYGVSVRQPIGGDFGFSGEVARRFLAQDVWETDVTRFGIDIFMTTTALNDKFQVAQANLGAKIHDAKNPAADLGPMFREVVGTLFDLMIKHYDSWSHISHGTEAPRFGECQAVEPEPLEVDLPSLVAKFRNGFARHSSVLQRVLHASNFTEIERLAATPAPRFALPCALWCRTVYDFATAYKAMPSDRMQLLEAMLPIYHGRVASFVLETEGMSTSAAETIVEAQCAVFEREKIYLLDRWNNSHPTRVMRDQPGHE